MRGIGIEILVIGDVDGGILGPVAFAALTVLQVLLAQNDLHLPVQGHFRASLRRRVIFSTHRHMWLYIVLDLPPVLFAPFLDLALQGLVVGVVPLL